MEAARRLLTAVPPVDGHSPAAEENAMKHYVAELFKMGSESQKAIVKHPAAAFQDILPASAAPSYLYILKVLLTTPTSEAGISQDDLRDRIVGFILGFNVTQVRYASAAMFFLLDQIAGGLFPPTVTCELLSTVILRLDPSGSELSSTHHQLVKLAYDANCLDSALPVINCDILSIADADLKTRKSKAQRAPLRGQPPPTLGGMSLPLQALLVLDYHLICGLIHMARRDWAKAQKAFGIVISHPTKDKAVSKVMTEAYKKWILVGLLNRGEPPVIPSQTTAFARSTYKSVAQEYIKLADLFTTEEAGQMKSLIETSQQLWTADGNATLVTEIQRSYQQWQIINLQRVYLNVPMSVIRTATISAESGEQMGSDEEVLALLRQMMEAGTLDGRIVMDRSGQPFLAFNDKTNGIVEEDFDLQVRAASESIKFLGERYHEVNSQLSHTKEYVRHLVREQKRAEKDPGVEFDATVEDEDLMTGIQKGP